MKTLNFLLVSLLSLFISCGDSGSSQEDQTIMTEDLEAKFAEYRNKVSDMNKINRELEEYGYQMRAGSENNNGANEGQDLSLMPRKTCEMVKSQLKKYATLGRKAQSIYNQHLTKVVDEKSKQNFRLLEKLTSKAWMRARVHLCGYSVQISLNNAHSIDQFKELSIQFNRESDFQFQTYKGEQIITRDWNFKQYESKSEVQKSLDIIEKFLFDAKQIQDIDQYDFISQRLKAGEDLQEDLLEILMQLP